MQHGRLEGKADLSGDPGCGAPRGILGPDRRQREPIGDRQAGMLVGHRPLATRIPAARKAARHSVEGTNKSRLVGVRADQPLAWISMQGVSLTSPKAIVRRPLLKSALE